LLAAALSKTQYRQPARRWTFEKSIEALRRLNAAGYGQGTPAATDRDGQPGRRLSRGAQPALEREWKAELAWHHGITFDRLITLNNMPISRFLEWLLESGNLQEYMERLTNLFNPATVAGLMCRNTLSVSWDGTLYDCDFNQMLDLPWRWPTGDGPTSATSTPMRSRPAESRRGATASGAPRGGQLLRGATA